VSTAHPPYGTRALWIRRAQDLSKSKGYVCVREALKISALPV
jgi:hypothetical protein